MRLEVGARFSQQALRFRAFDAGVMAAPGIFHPNYPAAQDVVTAPVAHGFIECLDPETGAVLGEAERLARLAVRAARPAA